MSAYVKLVAATPGPDSSSRSAFAATGLWMSGPGSAINPRLVSIAKLRCSETVKPPPQRGFSLWRGFGAPIGEKKAVSSHKIVVLD